VVGKIGGNAGGRGRGGKLVLRMRWGKAREDGVDLGRYKADNTANA
jgi:hypothetical protein